VYLVAAGVFLGYGEHLNVLDDELHDQYFNCQKVNAKYKKLPTSNINVEQTLKKHPVIN
jgi:hypothetical protein